MLLMLPLLLLWVDGVDVVVDVVVVVVGKTASYSIWNSASP